MLVNWQPLKMPNSYMTQLAISVNCEGNLHNLLSTNLIKKIMLWIHWKPKQNRHMT